MQRLEPEGRRAFALASSLVVKMRANMADAPYIFEKGQVGFLQYTSIAKSIGHISDDSIHGLDEK